MTHSHVILYAVEKLCPSDVAVFQVFPMMSHDRRMQALVYIHQQIMFVCSILVCKDYPTFHVLKVDSLWAWFMVLLKCIRIKTPKLPPMLR